MTGSTFRERVCDALSDERARRAVMTATAEREERRRARWAELADVEGLRNIAAEIKQHTLDHLDAHLARFIEKLEELGVTVHGAADAAEAGRAVVEIAERHGCRSIAKSKSMLSEELDLNEIVERAGLEIVETDLGEFLLQLDGDRPSHITAPAVHKDVESCAKTFAEGLGVPVEREPKKIVAQARAHLRDVFRGADMGITGANLGVAESGTIALVMNEGNGRFCVHRPKAHVVVMGIEKVVPTLKDAAVIVKLLARSATAQKMTVDTHLITGPMRTGEPDGAEAMHVILVDAGRTRILAGAQRDALNCIRCGACLNVCPVYRTLGGHAYGGTYPGPIGKVLTGLLEDDPTCELPHASSLCNACRDVCPVKIDLPGMLVQLRQQQAKETGRPRGKLFVLRAMMWVMKSPMRYRMGQRIARLMMRIMGRKGWVTKGVGPVRGWTKGGRDIQTLPRKAFRDLWRKGRIG
jgi:L-lactate dehydrogenase complex protein LldF